MTSNLRPIQGGKRRRSGGHDLGDAAAGCLIAFVLIAVLLPVLVALGALITMLGWNLGVVAIVAACGGHVAKIGFVTAIFANIAIGVVGRIFRRAPAAVNTSS